MFITAFVFSAWAMACWFSHPFGGNFLGIPWLFSIDALFPAIAALVFLISGVVSRRRKTVKHAATDPETAARRRQFFQLGGILLFAFLLQIPAMVLIQGSENSDTALYGIASYRIADGSERPIFAYGRHYIGTLLPHLAAPVHAFFGPQPVTMRLLTTGCYLAFILVIYRIVLLLLGNPAALIAATLAAVPPYFVFDRIKYIEYAEVFLWGALALLLLVRIIQEDRAPARRFFWLGACLGLGYWAHPQILSFALLAILAIALRFRVRRIPPAALAVPAGFMLGAMPALVDNWFSNWLQISGIFARQLDPSLNALSRLPERAGMALENVGNLLGSTPLSFASPWLRPWLPQAGLILFAACVALFVAAARRSSASGFRRAGLLCAGFTVIFLGIYLSSAYANPPAPVRYLLPLWWVLVVSIAAAIAYLARWRRAAAVILFTVWIGIFAGSWLQMIGYYQHERAAFTQWEDWCRRNRVTGFYGGFWKVYKTAWLTGERVVGSTISTAGPEYYAGYQERTAAAAVAPPWLFDPRSPEHAVFVDKVNKLEIPAKQVALDFGTVYFAFRDRLTPMQLAGVRQRPYRAGLVAVDARGYPGGMSRCSITAVNRGATTWQPSGVDGFIELVITGGDATVRRQPLMQVTHPSASCRWDVLLSDSEAAMALEARVQVNGITISGPALPIDAASGNAASLSSPLPELGAGNHWAYFDGWGAITGSGAARRYWSGARQSTYGFIAGSPEPLRFSAQVAPFQLIGFPDAADQRITVSLNGHRLVTIPAPRTRRVNLPLPLKFVQAGINRITFSYAGIEPYWRLENRTTILRCRPQAIGFADIRIVRER